jgi:Domain of unknown function (DUF222)/HNH endonuclease
MANMCSHQEIPLASDGPRPLEVLEREITSLTSQIHSATCRWLCLIAEYDARQGWGQWGAKSCAHWVSWQCGVAPGVAREHVRVARRLVQLPLIRAAFAEGELSYSKVRTLTRVENVEDEAELLRLARYATASQLERLLRAYRRVVRAERGAADGRPERWLECAHDDDGGVVIRGRFPGEEGELVYAALRAARDRLAREDVPAGTSGEDRIQQRAGDRDTAEGVPAGTPKPTIAEARADALLLLADSFLARGPAARTGGDRYQVVVHVDSATLHDGSGERCELDDGTPLPAETARRLACDASLVRVLERDGVPLKLGRKTRTIPPALRRALNACDGGCRFPGCTSRRFVDAHHIEHWAHGGATDLDNLVQLCRHHHRLLHEGRYGITRRPGGGLAFNRRDGRRIPIAPGRRGEPPGPLAPTRRPDACVTLSDGQLMDLGLAVEAVVLCAPITSSEPPGI